jgi:hypothetical protein
MKNRIGSLLVMFLALSFPGRLLCGTANAQEIKVGGIMDTTGATSDVGKGLCHRNGGSLQVHQRQGGVNGKPIKYTWFDYGYRIPEAITKYRLLKRLGVIAIQGWGTGDTEALSPTVNRDQMPYVSASYSAHLTDPGKDALQPLLLIRLFHQCQGRPHRLVRQEVAGQEGLRQEKAQACLLLHVRFPLCERTHQSHQGPCRHAGL